MSEQQSTDTIVISISDLRLRTLEAVVDHCSSGLPVPAKLSTIVYGEGRCGLTLQFETAEAVDAWSELLGLTNRDIFDASADDAVERPFRVHSAERRLFDGTAAWLGWTSVTAQAFVDIEAVSS
jgi:hypothetical protein